MKQHLVHFARAIIPRGVIQWIETLYRIARVHTIALLHGNPSKQLRVIAITGTNGKTTTANYLNEILKADGKKTALFSTAVIEINNERTPNTLNATVADVRSMQQFFQKAKRAHVDYLIMEFPSHAIHQHKLDDVPVELAIMTNLTQDHLDYHGTMDEYAAVKAKLFAKQPNYIVLNRDDSWYDFFSQYPAKKQRYTYGKSANSDVQIAEVTTSDTGTTATLGLAGTATVDVTLHLPGLFNVYNVAAAATAASLLGSTPDAIQRGVASVTGIPGRFEYVDCGKPNKVVVDYAHTPDGLEKLLTAVQAVTPGRVLLVFGACGDRDALKRPIMGEIAANSADLLFLTDEESYNEDPQSIRDMIRKGIERVDGATERTTEYADRRKAIQAALDSAQPNDTIAITGLGHEMYRIVKGKRIPWNDADVVRELSSKTTSR